MFLPSYPPPYPGGAIRLRPVVSCSMLLCATGVPDSGVDGD